MDDDAIHELIGMVYDAAYDRSKWAEHLEVVKARTGSLDAYLMSVDPTGAQAGMLEGPLVSSQLDRDYRDYYHKVDLWAHACEQSGIRVGQAWGSHELVSDAKLLASEIYNDFLRRYGCFYCAACFIVRDGPSSIAFGVIRSWRQGPADRETLRLITTLAPHQYRALLIDRRLRQLEANRRLGDELIDRLPYGVIVLDRRGRVLTMNRVAEEVVLAGEGLRLDGGSLAGLRAREEALLHTAIGRATAAPPAATTLDLARPTTLRPLRVVGALHPAPARAGVEPTPWIPRNYQFQGNSLFGDDPRVIFGFNPQPEPPASFEPAGITAFGFGFTSYSDVSVTLRMQDAQGGTVTLTRVPEPGTLGALCLGLLVMLGMHRRGARGRA